MGVGKVNEKKQERTRLLLQELLGTAHTERGVEKEKFKEKFEETLTRLSVVCDEPGDCLAAFKSVWRAHIEKGYLFNAELHALLEGAHALGIVEPLMSWLLGEAADSSDQEKES